MVNTVVSGVTVHACSGVSFEYCRPHSVPRQQLVGAIDHVVGTAFEDLGEPGLRVDVVELTRPAGASKTGMPVES